jgi:CO/xanthine dehydrogenase FAD-binding subunit
MGYIVPPPPPRSPFRSKGCYEWQISPEKPKTLDELLEEAAKYDPLAEIKAGRLSLIENKKKERVRRMAEFDIDNLMLKIRRLNETTNSTGPK